MIPVKKQIISSKPKRSSLRSKNLGLPGGSGVPEVQVEATSHRDVLIRQDKDPKKHRSESGSMAPATSPKGGLGYWGYDFHQD